MSYDELWRLAPESGKGYKNGENNRKNNRVNIGIIALAAGTVYLMAVSLAPAPQDFVNKTKRIVHENNQLLSREKKLEKVDPSFDSICYHQRLVKEISDSVNNDDNGALNNPWIDKAKYCQKQETRLKNMSAHLGSMEKILYRRLKAQPTQPKQFSKTLIKR